MKYLLVKEGITKALKDIDAILGDNETAKEEINESTRGFIFGLEWQSPM